MTITADQVNLLNKHMGSIARKVQLGTLIQNAETIVSAELPNDSVSAEHLDDGVLPSHVVKYAGKHTTVGGAAAEAITVTGVLSTDIVMVTLQTEGASAVSVVKAAPTADTVTVTFSADPAADHIVAYTVLRAVV